MKDNHQRSLFDMIESKILWREVISSTDLIADKETMEIRSAPCEVTAEVTENGRLTLCCSCETGQIKSGQNEASRQVCDHILRVIGGDIYVLSNYHDYAQRASLLKIYQACLTTEIYDLECNIYDLKITFSKNNQEIKALLDQKNSATARSVDLHDIDTELTRLRAVGRSMKAEIMKYESVRDFRVTFAGLILDAKDKRHNSLRVMDSLTRFGSERSTTLPLFIPENIDDCGWYMYPCKALGSSIGLCDIERTRQISKDGKTAASRHYLARTQTNNFSFERGDVFYDTPIARRSGVRWEDALPFIHNVVQIQSSIKTVRDDELIQMVTFTACDPHTGKTNTQSMYADEFVRYLINGDRNG